jgi:hypothetical protein
MKTKARTFKIWTYDVLGNAREGFDVNDRYGHGLVTIICRREIFNAGTPNEFETFEPTDRQLSRAANVTGAEWEGSDGVFYAKAKRNGRPLGELVEESE